MTDEYEKYKLLPSNEALQKSSFRYFKFYLTTAFLMMLIIGYLEFKTFSTKDLREDQAVIHLRNLIDDEKSLLESDGNKIIFIESHLESERSLEKPRQACSVEAAARLNPEVPVYLLFATDTNEVKLNRSRYTDVLATYSNVHIRYANVYEFGAGTVLQEFMNDGAWKTSEYQLEHVSDIIRALAIYKYGGLYMDLDVLMLKPWRSINQMNFFCTEYENFLANSIFHFDTKLGRKFTLKALEEFRDNYDPNEYAINGPSLFTRVAMSLCSNVQFEFNKTTQCDVYKVFHRDVCFPVTPGDYRKFYQADDTGDVIKVFRDSYFTHIWNHMQIFAGEQFDQLALDSWAPYIQLARTFCPRVYDSLDEYFK